MEELKNNQIYRLFFFVFIIFSIIHISYATITMRAAYEDGSFYFLQMLQNIADGNFSIIYDSTHTRYMHAFLTQVPVYLVDFVFGITDKFTLLKVYSFVTFLFPLLALLWNFKLTERTKRIDVLFWSLFSYGLLLLPCMIFSMVEILIGATFNFLLWNYLVSDIDYKKRDILAILFLLIVMFSTYEYIAILGFVFFFTHFYYVFHSDKGIKNKAVKILIGFGSMASSIYNIWFMSRVDGEAGEIMRFLKEAHDFLPYVFNLNSLFTIATLIILIAFLFLKKNISKKSVLLIVFVFVILLAKMLLTQNESVYPMWEQHFRTVPCWALPLIFLFMHIRNVIRGEKEINFIKYTNLIIVVFICAIFQTFWQCVNTYYWDKNIQYMKDELKKEESLLYIPAEHEELSGFHNEKLRRYIWHGSFPATSILFSEAHEQKTLLMLYDVQVDDGNVIDRAELFYDRENKKLSVPFGAYIDVKNRFWDLTKVAEALDKYNKENNIQTCR